MRLSLVLLATVCSAVNGFAPSQSFEASASRTDIRSSALFQQETPCDIPADILNPDLVSQRGSGKLLRSAMLIDVNGDKIMLGNRMGTNTSVVIFLRHMG
jgi:hypothetical protein